MKPLESISNTDKINYLNIGLMLLSLGVSYLVPFELFLFSYAVLGPAHYLTEISWLHERKYFSKGKYDYIFLGIAGVLLFLLIYVVRPFKVFPDQVDNNITTGIVFIAFAASLAMVLLKSTFKRFIAFIIICVTSVIAKSPAAFLFFAVFLPTLIHVFLFTLFFMLYGALKGRSKSGYLSCLIMVLCPLLLIFYAPESLPISHYAMMHYPSFHTVNIEVMKLFNIDVFRNYNPQVNAVYQSTTGLTVMRFIAFAYTYHYLNWFSKTSIIKWHNVPKKRLIVIGVLWAAAVGFYVYDYKLGFNVLFLLSFLHVFLEFPLNHVTILGIFRETRTILGKKQPVPVVSKNNRTKQKKKA